MGRAEDIFQRIIEHGEDEIDEFIHTRKSEELFLDFKRSADQGTGRRLHQNDRNNLAKAISGFGNSEGGVVVWGIDCSSDEDYADVAHTKFPIQNVKRFVSWLEGSVSGCTIPPHVEVQNHPITINSKGDGFAATYVPKSIHAPHQVVGKLQYFIRAGSSFVPTPHAVLAEMFGRRPQPHLSLGFITPPAKLTELITSEKKIEIQVGFMIRNNGPGIASDLFINVMVFSSPGDNCELSFHPTDLNNWTCTYSLGRHMSAISKPDIRVPPESQVQPLIINLSLSPPFLEELKIDGIYGCGQSPSSKFMIQKDAVSIEKLYESLLKKDKRGRLTEQDGHDLVKDLWNTKTEERS